MITIQQDKAAASSLRYAHLPADVAAEHTGPTAVQRVRGAGSISDSTPAGAMDDAFLS